MNRQLSWYWVVSACGGLLTATAAGQSPATALQPASDKIVIATTPSELTRPGTLKGVTVMEILAGARPKPEKLVRKGVVRVDAESFNLYLPAPPYELENSGRDDGALENTATRIAIDANGDGSIAGEENWYANLPLRIADRMYRITTIADDGSQVELQPLADAPRGLIVGRKAPDFSYTATDGRTYKREDFAGKAFLVDIWSVT